MPKIEGFDDNAQKFVLLEKFETLPLRTIPIHRI